MPELFEAQAATCKGVAGTDVTLLMRKTRLACALLALVPAVTPNAAVAQADATHFESRIRPVLVEHCYECHSQASGKAKGGLRLDTREALRTGGDSGPALVAGDPDASLLLQAIEHRDPDLAMPPNQARLPASVLTDFRQWIAAGAPDPRTENASSTPAAKGSHWSLRPLARDFEHDSIDAFIGGSLRAEGLAPSPPASPRSLLRRLHFTLIGLPPSPAETTAFVQGKVSLEATVDRLLASPEFGVRWGRHWLDVARFAESNGRESNLAFPHAWRYRDYVIDAFNADLPFDRFIIEQLAGDLLPARNDAERARLLIATGFLALGAKGLNEMNPAQFAADLADEQLDTTSRAFLASSIACARCHDHKTDPYSMEDYYALSGIFQSTETFYGNWIDSENNNSSRLICLPDLPGQFIPNAPLPKAEVQKLKNQLAQLNAEEKAQTEYIEKARAEGRDLGEEGYRLLANSLRIYWTRGGVEGRLMTVDDEGRALPLCMGVLDKSKTTEAHLLERGELAHPGERVPRRFPAALSLEGAPLPSRQSGRLELAQWITHPEHPLTARVLANRLWRHLFGAGLVRTVDDFGRTGEAPSHPELLDFLARRLLENGWSVKALIREIVLSDTWQQSSDLRADAFAKDPDNRLLWRQPKRRLDAEVIRDSMLAVAGQLDLTRRPGSLVNRLNGPSISLVGFNDQLPPDLDGSRHRSIYLPIFRDHLPDLLEQFDFAAPSLVMGDRAVTNVPLQALYLMNSAFVQDQARALATRIGTEADLSARLRRAFVLCFNRRPDASEIAAARAFITAAQEKTDAPTALIAFCQSLLASAEFRIQD